MVTNSRHKKPVLYRAYHRVKLENSTLREQLRLLSDHADTLQDVLDMVKEQDSLHKLEFSEKVLKEYQSLINSIVRVMNYRFGADAWLNYDFESSNFDTCDSNSASDDIARILREFTAKTENEINHI